jgi:hypothetical protein
VYINPAHSRARTVMGWEHLRLSLLLSLSTTHHAGQKSTKNDCLDRGSNTGPLDLQSNALPTELSKQVASITAKHGT